MVLLTSSIGDCPRKSPHSPICPRGETMVYLTEVTSTSLVGALAITAVEV